MGTLGQLLIMAFSIALPVALIASVWAYAARRRRHQLEEDDE